MKQIGLVLFLAVLLFAYPLAQAQDSLNWCYRIYFEKQFEPDSSHISFILKFEKNKDKLIVPLFASFMFWVEYDDECLEPDTYFVGDRIKGWMVYDYTGIDAKWNFAGATGTWGTGDPGLIPGGYELLRMRFKSLKEYWRTPLLCLCLMEESAQGWSIPLKAEYMLGDFNLDGFLDNTDVVILTNYIFAGGEVFEPYRMDMNRDGIWDFMDILSLIQRANKKQ